MNDTAYMLTLLEVIPPALTFLIGGLSRDDLHASAGGDEDWQCIEVVGHMGDASDAHLTRITDIISHDNPALIAFDQEVRTREKGYRAMDDAVPLLEKYSADSTRTVAALKDLPPNAWQRTGIHSTDGEMTLHEVVRRISNHALVHYNQIARSLVPQRIAAIAALPEKLAARLAELTEARMTERTLGESEWTVREVVGHLRDMPEVYSARARQIVSETNPRMFGIDQETWVRERNYNARETGAVLNEYRAGNRDLIALLNALPADVWARPAIHPTRGAATYYDIALTFHLAHFDLHMNQIEKTLAA